MFSRLRAKHRAIAIEPLQHSGDLIDSLPHSAQHIAHLIQLSEQDVDYLQQIDDIMEEHVATIAERHYDMIMNISEIKNIFNQYTTYERYIAAISHYFTQLTNPQLTEEYIIARKKIGIIHSEIGLTEEWFIGSYIRVYEYIIPHIVARFSSQPMTLANVILALNKIIIFDIIIVLEAYNEANEYELIDRVSKAMDEVTKIDEVGTLLTTVERTEEEASDVDRATEQLNHSIIEVTATANDVNEQTNKMVDQAIESKETIERSLTGFLSMIEEFQQSSERVQALTEKVNNISEVVDFIKSIADETNLLALNASIEAARAGEQGRGFSVVADEVRTLAEQTRKSVENITNEMEKVQVETNEVSTIIELFSKNLGEHVNQTNVSMQSIEVMMEQITDVHEATESIAQITEKESSVTENIRKRVNTLLQNVEKTKELTLLTGQAVLQAGVGVNDIRTDSLAAIKNPTEQQMKRVTDTEQRVVDWLRYNKEIGLKEK